MPGQPNLPDHFVFNVTDLRPLETGPPPPNIIPVNTDFDIYCNFEFRYYMGHIFHEDHALTPENDFRVKYYAEELGGPNDQLLGEKAGTFNSDPNVEDHYYGESDTKRTVSGGISTPGTYRLTCTVDCLDMNGNMTGYTGFYEGPVIQISEA